MAKYTDRQRAINSKAGLLDGAADVGALGRRALSASATLPGQSEMVQAAFNNRRAQTGLHDRSILAQTQIGDSLRADQKMQNEQDRFYSGMQRALGNDAYGRRFDQQNFAYKQDRDKTNDFKDDRDFTRTLARDQQDIYRDDRNFDYGAKRDQVGDTKDAAQMAYNQKELYDPSAVAGSLGPDADGNFAPNGLMKQYAQYREREAQKAAQEAAAAQSGVMQKQAQAMSGKDLDAVLYAEIAKNPDKEKEFYAQDGSGAVLPAGMAFYQEFDRNRMNAAFAGLNPDDVASVAKDALANPEAARAKVDNQGRMNREPQQGQGPMMQQGQGQQGRMNRDPMWFLGGQAQSQPAPMQNQQAPAQQAQQAPAATSSMAQRAKLTPQDAQVANQQVAKFLQSARPDASPEEIQTLMTFIQQGIPAQEVLDRFNQISGQ